MRYYFYFFLLATFSSASQTKTLENDSLLIWNENRKITWNDFLSKDFTIVKKHTVIGVTNTVDGAAISMSIEIYPKELNCKNYEDVIIVAVMNKKESCVIFKRDEVLNHEQTHFDIAELYARKIRKKISEYNGLKKECNLEAIAEIYYRLEEGHWQAQFLYDKEVRIEGKREQNQKKWDRKVDSLIGAYQKYERDIYMEDLK